MYTVRNVKTEEERELFGYWFEDAIRRSKLNADDWKVIFKEYMD
jgi:hypothetical protein